MNKTYNGDSQTIRVFDGYSYEYDKQNRISAIKQLDALGTETELYSYEYDKLGQLVRYNDNKVGKSYTYTYDNNGNILTKSEYAYATGVLGDIVDTITYGYDHDWADKLISVDGEAITYDNIGNPTSYLGATLTWEGRQLISYSNAENTFSYEYDENGMRYRTTITGKDDSVGYLDYVWVDSKLISISFTSDELNQTVKYLYNDFDEHVGFVATREDGTVDTFYYLKNAQGDITHIVSAAGKKMVSFTYDVFGKRTVTYQATGSTTPGQIELLTQMKADLLNPFAYRGYCYDYDMGMYYLQSRYYDPNIGRFINADDTKYLNVTGTVLGCNLFAYCENDPVNKVDPKGNFVAHATSAVLGALISVISDIITQCIIYWATHSRKFKGIKIDWWSIAWSGIVGLATGAVMMSRFKTAGNALISAIIGVVDGIVTAIKNKTSVIKSVLISVFINVVAAIIGGKGVGFNYYKKSFLTKGGSYYYGKNISSSVLLLSKGNVRKDFVKALIKYCYGAIVSVFTKVVTSR